MDSRIMPAKIATSFVIAGRVGWIGCSSHEFDLTIIQPRLIRLPLPGGRCSNPPGRGSVILPLRGWLYLTEDVFPSRTNSPDSTKLLNSVIACSYPIPSNTRHCLLVIKPFCFTNIITCCLISSLIFIVVADFIRIFPFLSLTFAGRCNSETLTDTF